MVRPPLGCLYRKKRGILNEKLIVIRQRRKRCNRSHCLIDPSLVICHLQCMIGCAVIGRNLLFTDIIVNFLLIFIVFRKIRKGNRRSLSLLSRYGTTDFLTVCILHDFCNSTIFSRLLVTACCICTVNSDLRILGTVVIPQSIYCNRIVLLICIGKDRLIYNGSGILSDITGFILLSSQNITVHLLIRIDCAILVKLHSPILDKLRLSIHHNGLWKIRNRLFPARCIICIPVGSIHSKNNSLLGIAVG